MPVKFNSKQVTIPFFQVGEEEIDLVKTLEAIEKAIKAQKG